MHSTRYVPLLLILVGAGGFLAFHHLGKQREAVTESRGNSAAVGQTTASAAVPPANGMVADLSAQATRSSQAPKAMQADISTTRVAASPAPVEIDASYPDGSGDTQADQSGALEHPEITDPKMRQLLKPAWAD